MAANRIEAIHALLGRAEEEHGVYEGTVLNGVYDAEWPRWYAAYAVEHGIGHLVGHDVTVDRLAAYLTTSNADFDQIDPRPDEPWAAYTARRIATEL